jgi:hypothetical protein
MATKAQINLVKASHRRIKELLEGTGIEARVSYTSDTDLLQIVFTKHFHRNRVTLEVTCCTSVRELSINSGVIEEIVREVLHDMPQQKGHYTSPEAFCAELNSLVDEYRRAGGAGALGRCIRVADDQVHIIVTSGFSLDMFNKPDGKGGRYGIYPLPLDYEAADAYFVDLIDKCTNGGYSRWVAAGMPKKFNPVQAVTINPPFRETAAFPF